MNFWSIIRFIEQISWTVECFFRLLTLTLKFLPEKDLKQFFTMRLIYERLNFHLSLKNFINSEIVIYNNLSLIKRYKFQLTPGLQTKFTSAACNLRPNGCKFFRTWFFFEIFVFWNKSKFWACFRNGLSFLLWLLGEPKINQ